MLWEQEVKLVKSKELRIRSNNFSETDLLLISYFEQMGQGKVAPLMTALNAFFYPEMAYEKDLLQENQREVFKSLCTLESRVRYLKQLTDIRLTNGEVGDDGLVKKTIETSFVKIPVDSEASSTKRTSHGVSGNSSQVSSSNCKYGDDDSIEIPDDDDDNDLEANPYDDGL